MCSVSGVVARSLLRLLKFIVHYDPPANQLSELSTSSSVIHLIRTNNTTQAVQLYRETKLHKQRQTNSVVLILSTSVLSATGCAFRRTNLVHSEEGRAVIKGLKVDYYECSRLGK